MARPFIPWNQYSSSKAGRQLEEFRAFDFRSMPTELRAVFALPGKIQLQYVGTTARACKDLAPHYVLDPRRTYPDALQGVELQEVSRILSRLRRTFLQTEQAGVAQQGYAYLCAPDETGRELRVTPVLGYQFVDVQWPSVLECDDLRRASRVRFAVPTAGPQRAMSNVPDRRPTSVAFVEITPDTAIITYPDGTQQGVLAPDGSNPLGYIPMVGRRRELPADRVLWIPDPAYDLQSVQIAAILGISDVVNVLRIQAPGVLTAKGPGARKLKAKIQVTPGTIIPLPNEDVELAWLQAQPISDKYLAAISFGLSLVENYRYIRPGGLSGITGAAKMVDGQGLTEERSRQDGDLVEVEQQLLDTAIDVRNTLLPKALKLPADIGREMSVVYNLPRPRENILQERQSLALACSLGIDSAVEFIMLNEGVDQTRAEKLYQERLQRWRDSVAGAGTGGSVPGMDRLAAQVSKPLTQTQDAGGGDAGNQARDTAAAAEQAG